MTTMIERVARAIAKMAENDSGCYSDRCGCLEAEAFECKSGLKIADIARAAIQAMREPTEGMAIAGYGTDDAVQGHDCAAIWRLMIDAALAEEPK